MHLKPRTGGVLMAALALILSFGGCAETMTTSPTACSPPEVSALAKGGRYGGDRDADLCEQYKKATGCTRTQGYWKNHLDWPCPFTPGGYICVESQITFYEGIITESDGNPYWILSQQYVAALLNRSANKGEIPAEIQEIINKAQLYFMARQPDNPLGTVTTSTGRVLPGYTREEIILWSQILDEFNNGLRGLISCDANGG